MVEIVEGEVIFSREELDVRLLVDVEQLAVVEVRAAPGWGRAALHVHARHAEALFVFEGELALRLEDRMHRIGPETWAFVPPEVVHAFEVAGDKPARFLVFHTPSSGFGDYVRGSATDFDQQPPPEYATGDPGLVVVRRKGSGVGSTESPKSGGVSFAGAGAGSGVGSTESPKSGGTGFAGAGAGSGVGSTESPKSGGVGFAGAGAGAGDKIADQPDRRSTILIEADELVVSEFMRGPGVRGAERHVHHHHADAFLVVEGELTLAVGSGSLRAPAGTLVVFPPNVVHGFDNDSAESVLLYNLHLPGSGFGDYLRGRKPDFDQHDPPADGGADPASAVAVRLSG